MDLVYIGIGGAFTIMWEFYIGSFIGRFHPRIPFADVSFWGKTNNSFHSSGVGWKSWRRYVNVIYTDLLRYGFGGEPMFFMYEMLTYGLFVDLVFTKGKIFGIDYTPKEVD